MHLQVGFTRALFFTLVLMITGCATTSVDPALSYLDANRGYSYALTVEASPTDAAGRVALHATIARTTYIDKGVRREPRSPMKLEWSGSLAKGERLRILSWSRGSVTLSLDEISTNDALFGYIISEAGIRKPGTIAYLLESPGNDFNPFVEVLIDMPDMSF